MCVCVRASAGTAQGEDSAEHEDFTQTEAVHLEVRAGLRCHRAGHAVVPRTTAGGAGWTR